MSPEKQRIAIAEFCGWKMETLPDSRYECGSHACRRDVHIQWNHPFGQYSPVEHEGFIGALPDYANDLNAIHEAELRLTDEQHNNFQAHLMGKLRARILKQDELWQSGYDPIDRALLSAEAEDRAECVVKAIGKWEESS